MIVAYSYLSLVLLSSPATGPREIHRMRDIEPAIEPGTLVIFDIDNTLIESVQMLGSDQWFYALVEQLRAQEKLDETRAVDRAMEIWNAVQADTEVRPVETDTPALIRRLAQRDVPMLALTARTFEIADVTMRQLRSVGIDFERGAIAADLELELSSPAKLIGGIMYVGETNSKGEVLVELVKRTKLRTKKIVFVDDKQKHVASVSAALTAAGIPFHSFRYGAADAHVKAFEADVAAMQLRWWRKVISDDAAKDLLDPKR